MSPADANVARFLAEEAERRPDADAVLVVRGRRIARTGFAALEARANRMARALRSAGVREGDRTCVFVPPGPELVALAYALWKLAAVPVLMDPGMGRVRLAACIAKVEPRAFVGVPKAHALRLLHRDALRSVELFVAAGARGAWIGNDLARMERRASDAPLSEPARGEDVAAVLFTSGATGPPKGVVYTHANFRAQIEALRALYGFERGETDVACFPLFALFCPALGMSAAFPELDPARPARCEPERVVDAIRATGATTSFGSPAIWKRVAPWCSEHGVKLEGMRRVLVAGAPVPVRLFEALVSVLGDEGDVYAPYGATEALPVASISGRELLRSARVRIASGYGTCIGAPAPGIETRIVPITDEVLGSFDGVEEVAQGQPGELCVAGEVVTRAYFGDEKANALAKVREGDRVWHRMGDVAWRGVDGRLWFCGRKSHRVESSAGLVLPVPVENVMNEREEIERSALVGVGERGNQRPVLVVEPREGALPREKGLREAIKQEILAAAKRNPKSAVIEEVLFHPSLPVDVRHNAKIDAPALERWAAEELE